MLSDILLTVLLVLLNGFFVATEFAIVKVRSSQVDLKEKQGHRFATLTKNVLDNLNHYLSATQLGITLASLGLGWVGEEVTTNVIIQVVHRMGFSADPLLIHKISVPVAFIFITVLHIVFG